MVSKPKFLRKPNKTWNFQSDITENPINSPDPSTNSYMQSKSVSKNQKINRNKGIHTWKFTSWDKNKR